MIFECEHCQAHVDGKEAGHFRHVFHEIGVPMRFTLLECPRCHSPAVSVQELEQAGREDWEWSTPHRIFPTEREISREIPANIRRSFEEALKCQRTGAHLAAVIMSRRTLETLAAHYVGDVRNLAKALEELHTQGIIDDRLKKWTDTLREDGNLAAHDPNPNITSADAADVIDFTEAILEYVFVLHERFQDFEKRRAERAKRPPGGKPGSVDLDG